MSVRMEHEIARSGDFFGQLERYSTSMGNGGRQKEMAADLLRVKIVFQYKRYVRWYFSQV